MLADALKAINDDGSPTDGIAELVVTALGSGGQYYICWRTQLGTYKQRSDALPARLEQWLFPPDGTTRDFESLQVILYGDDTFLASDRDGEIRSEQADTSSPRNRFRRATTMSEGTGWLHRRSTGLRPEVTDLQHKRAMSADRPSASRARPLSLLGGGGSSSPSSRTTTSASHHRNSVMGRTEGRNRLKEVEEQTGQSLPRLLTRTSSFKRGVERSETWSRTRRSLSPALTGESPEAPESACSCHTHDIPVHADSRPHGRPAYADAGVQTDMSTDSSPKAIGELLRGRGSQIDGDEHQQRQYQDGVSNREYATLHAGIRQSPCEHYHHRDGIETAAIGFGSNPVIMGRMQDYFRSGMYTLGQALDQ
ncbi:uncharacterized protein B0I36DRAFT_366338 [Microdochium trichocladiopsis]|uniref:Uncharacterized protein n=1 Tax=Microdochium trichocladiopsis TaxID=1682393 RepID=A0A9P8XYG0_9PEZI|nr:uncharacterized protein B0I36DRAFT_366338 [Microdochium trichocladiopsis]KAH7024390.1 hypothetical protein B0I36DRAFT_366338 [Microdochium trichocladiopsis]